jgi:uncharacterized protein YjiS (DUF1127 family)
MLEEGAKNEVATESRDVKLARLSSLLQDEADYGDKDRELRQTLFNLKQGSTRRRELIFDLLDDLGLERGGVDWEVRNGGS